MVVDAKPKQTSRNFLRFGINTLLMTMALIATVIGTETNRYRHRSILEKSPHNLTGRRISEYVRCSRRFESLDPDGLFAASITKVFGPRWNEVIISVVVGYDELDEHVFDSITQLRHVRALGFRESELTESQFARLAKMKSLQWLYLVDTNVDQATIDSLRKALPNTFVTGVSDADG